MENHEVIEGGHEAAPENFEALLPDGIGMDLEDLRRNLAAAHDTMVRADDPIMMQITIFNSFLGELEKLLERHNNALGRVMTGHMEKYISGVKETTDSLGKVLANTSVDAIREIFNRHDAVIHKGSVNNLWCAGIVALSAAVNVAVFVVK